MEIKYQDTISPPTASSVLGEIINEWLLLKLKMSDANFRVENLKEISWEKINLTWSVELPNLLNLVDLILSLSSSTAECERSHFQRSLLNFKTLDDLKMIHMNSKEYSSFDPAPTIDVWFTKKQR